MSLPPLDLHAHVSPDISDAELAKLDAVIFAATPSLAEASSARHRQDPLTVWGVGCHPGLLRPQRAFNIQAFDGLIETSPFVGEVGLDGDSRVPQSVQVETLTQILSALRNKPRLTSLHSYRATTELVSLLGSYRIKGAILHWWLGGPDDTRTAVSLGCYFSVNQSSARRVDVLEHIPLDRILTETDHPAGDRFGGRNARPGNVRAVERALGKQYGLSVTAVRDQLWRNFDNLVLQTEVERMLPRKIRLRLATL